MPQSADELKQAIVEIVEESFNEKGKGVFLSTLGLILNKRDPEFRVRLNGRKLADFISVELAGKVSIISPEVNTLIKVAVPSNSVDGAEQESVVPQIGNSAHDLMPRYSRAVWSAFSSSIENGCSRILRLMPYAHYRDVPDSNPVPPNYYKVEAEYIVGEDYLSGRKAMVHSNILRWCQVHEVDFEKVLVKKENIESGSNSAISLLERIISTLSESDLKRIQLPLDIVEKLLKEV